MSDESFLKLKQMVRDKFVSNDLRVGFSDVSVVSNDVSVVSNDMNVLSREAKVAPKDTKVVPNDMKPVLLNKSKLPPLTLLGQYLWRTGRTRSEAFAFLKTRRVDNKYVSEIEHRGKKFFFKCRNPAVSKDEVSKQFLNTIYPGMYGNKFQTSCKSPKDDWLRLHYESIGLGNLWEAL